jgi:long-chain acyl-CoA synthetase
VVPFSRSACSREVSQPIARAGAATEIRDFANIHEVLRATVDRCPERDAYRWILPDGHVRSVTWRDFYGQVRQVARSLIALDVGPGDKVAIVSYTSYRWLLVDLAAATIGACTVGIYQTLLAKDCQYILDHSDSVVVFVENQDQLAKLLTVREGLPRVRKAVMMAGAATGDWALDFERLLAMGESVAEDVLAGRIAGVSGADLAAIVYTSGTTGVPKGAMLTHDNITFTAQSVSQCTEHRDGDVQLLFLPLAHVFARACAYAALVAGATTVLARGLDRLGDDFKIACPNWFASVPAVYEKVQSRIVGGVEAKGGLALRIFRWARTVGERVSDKKLARQEIPPALKLAYGVAFRLVFSKIHAALGGRVRWCISGAAPLNPQVGVFFHAAGVLILEGIGMTENTSFSHVNRVDDFRFGWVGRPGPGIEHRIAEDGELLIRGRNVMKGYYKMPAETAETVTSDGWLRTGDLGEIDAEGFLRITGRKKDLIITAGGKNVAPVPIETMLAESKYISRACVVGDRRKYLAALVSLDPDNARDYALKNAIPFTTAADLQTDERIVRLVEGEVAERNRRLASFETIKKVAIVDEFTIENGLLTPTLKVKRAQAIQRYQERVEAMYRES